MKLKALYSAVALILFAGPVGATQPAASSEREGVFAQEQDLPQDHTERSAAAGISDAAADEISAALKAKIRAIIAFMREETHNTSGSTKLLRSRIHVHCSARHITVKRKPSLTAAPALLLEQQTASERTPISTMLEACTIKLLQIRRTEPPEPAKREFSVELPSPRGTTP
jgi:hypothetical protein